MRLWHKTSNLFMHIIFFSSVIIFLLDFIGGTKALWYCDILTHICSWFTYFFFVRFHIINLASLSNILFFFCLPFSEKREKRIKENIFSVHSFHLFLYVYHIDSLALHTLHMFTLLTFGQPFMKFSVYDFFCRLFFVLKLFFSL